MVRIVKKFVERRADIVKTARLLFRTKEYEKTTMQDIMNALEIAKGTIYHYFKSKEELLEAVIEDIVDQSVQRMQVVVQENTGSALEKMKLLVQMGNIPAADNESILEYLHKPKNYALHSRVLGAILIRQAPHYVKIIQQGCNEGIFKTEAPLECAEFIFSAVQFLTDRGIYPWTQEDLQRRVQAFPRLIEQQLMAPPGSFQFLLEPMSVHDKYI